MVAIEFLSAYLWKTNFYLGIFQNNTLRSLFITTVTCENK